MIESNRFGQGNTPTASLQRGKTPYISVLDMILNNLMVRFRDVEYHLIAIALRSTLTRSGNT